MPASANPNPYESPRTEERQRQRLRYLPPDPRIAWRLKVPAVTLLVLSGLQLVPIFPFWLNLAGYVIARLQSNYIHFEFVLRSSVIADATLLAIVTMTTLTIFCGAWYMLQVRAHSLCTAAAVLACVPLVSPLLVVGIPFGIWAIVALSLTSTRDEFRRIANPVPEKTGIE
jgi:hypothetical protein